MITQAEHIINKFGSMGQLARKINRPPTTVQTWKKSGYIKICYHSEIIEAGVKAGISIGPADFLWHLVPDSQLISRMNEIVPDKSALI